MLGPWILSKLTKNTIRATNWLLSGACQRIRCVVWLFGSRAYSYSATQPHRVNASTAHCAFRSLLQIAFTPGFKRSCLERLPDGHPLRYAQGVLYTTLVQQGSQTVSFRSLAYTDHRVCVRLVFPN